MKVLLKLSVVLFLVLFFEPDTHAQWINEIHYDNSGTDAGECIEIMGLAGTDLSCLQLVLYNGSTTSSAAVTYSTTTLSGTIADQSCGYGVASHCYAVDGIQNGSNDGIALYNSCTGTVLQFLSYEGSITASNGPASGMTSTNIPVSESSTTPIGYSLQLSGNGSSYSDFTWQTASASNFGSLNAGQSVSPCGVSNTINVGNVSASSFSVTCSTGATGSVDFTSTGTFNPSNTYTAILSDPTGSFTNSQVIGSLSSTANSGTININIPPGLPSSNNYLIQIVSSDPAVTSGNTSTSFTITNTESCTPPYITSVIINSCNETCTEGYNEIVFGNSGDYSFDVTPANFNISYGTSLPGTVYTDVLVNNSTSINAINTAAGCPGTFIDATGTTIPSGASWMMAYENICEEALDWSGLCSSGPIYVIFQNDPNWNTNGTFKNGADGGPRFFNSTITTTAGSTFSIDYEYNSTLLQTGAAGDGDFVTWDSNGGTPSSYGDNNCILEPNVLPVDLIAFVGMNEDPGNHLMWLTASEHLSAYFELDRSIDGENWVNISKLAAAYESSYTREYHVTDTSFPNSINYYRLVQFDVDGNSFRYPVYISIDNRKALDAKPILITNLLGQTIRGDEHGMQIHLFSDGSIKRVFR